MDQANFERMFREHFSPLTNIANAMVRDKDTACDIVQHVFIKLWDKIEKVEINTSERSYLHRAVVNATIDYLEKNKRLVLRDRFTDFENNIIDEPDENNKEGQQSSLNQKLNDAIDELPEKCRIVFSLSRIEGMKNAEIAEHLDISIKTVEKHIGNALRHLRMNLKDVIYTVFLFLAWIFN
jgi:RNA polymerase sigma-70 factor (ECF subfamily)